MPLSRRCKSSSFQKGKRKDELAAQMRARFPHAEGVVFVGKAQEKSTALVNHYYFYCVDENFGPLFLKFCSYFPTTPSYV
jgi:hypothetical protein